MKKYIIGIISLFIFPINIFALPTSVIPGGENIAIKIKDKGLLVIGYYKVNNDYIAEDNIKIKDKIIKVNDIDINSVSDFEKAIENAKDKNNVYVTVLRDNIKVNTKLNLVYDNNKYKTGIYVKDGINGIGTISYIDPLTKTYGALGHEIIESNTRSMVEIKTGNIYESLVTSIEKSTDGSPGSKNATLEFNKKLGTINENTKKGIYGKIDKIPNKDTLKVAEFNEIKKGKAYIYTTLEDNQVKKYEIEIIEINNRNINTSKSFTFNITDKELLSKTGGIVQGMSGSPIIQDNKIIGAVTHVIVDNVKKGYGIYIKTMLKEGEN